MLPSCGFLWLFSTQSFLYAVFYFHFYFYFYLFFFMATIPSLHSKMEGTTYIHGCPSKNDSNARRLLRNRTKLYQKRFLVYLEFLGTAEVKCRLTFFPSISGDGYSSCPWLTLQNIRVNTKLIWTAWFSLNSNNQLVLLTRNPKIFGLNSLSVFVIHCLFSLEVIATLPV